MFAEKKGFTSMGRQRNAPELGKGVTFFPHSHRFMDEYGPKRRVVMDFIE
jgi:hypothetical protein